MTLDSSLFEPLSAGCELEEYVAWTGLLLAAQWRGDAEGCRLLEAMIERRLAG